MAILKKPQYEPFKRAAILLDVSMPRVTGKNRGFLGVSAALFLTGCGVDWDATMQNLVDDMMQSGTPSTSVSAGTPPASVPEGSNGVRGVGGSYGSDNSCIHVGNRLWSCKAVE